MGNTINTRGNTPVVEAPPTFQTGYESKPEDLARKKRYSSYAAQANRKGRGEFFQNAPKTSSPLSGATPAQSQSLLKSKLGE